MPDRRPQRLEALTQAILDAHLDGLLLTSLPNIRYVTGFSGTSAIALVTTTDATLITDFRYQTQATAEVGDLARVVIEPQSLWSGLWHTLPPGSPGVIGFESHQLVHRDFQRLLEQGARWQWRPTLDMVEALRERKDEDELALIAKAAGVADAALDRAIAQVRVGMTELEIAGALERALREFGSEGFPFPTIVASGERSALPHARSSERAVQRRDFLLIDFGAVVGGYCADVTRTFVVGPATEEQREIHSIVREANERASRAIRAGMRGRDADAVARGYIEDRGFGDAFGHSLGHGIGIEVHEAPRLARTAEASLPKHAVVTIEPGIYRPGWGGVRIEDDVFIDDGGARVLTAFSRDLIEI
ncbi:MAG: M24 family metallopeptidase [Gemmatimonadaceae bacterium]